MTNMHKMYIRRQITEATKYLARTEETKDISATAEI